MSGGGGGAVSQSNNQSTYTDLPDWLKDPEMQLAGQIGQQLNYLPSITSQMQGGGIAPVNGVFTGDATTVPTHAPVNPQGAFGPLTPPLSSNTSGGNFKSSAPISFGGNGMGSGIGNLNSN